MTSKSVMLLGLAAMMLSLAPAQAEDIEARTARRFEQIRTQPLALDMFLRAMPKGGDLHNHLDGAIYAESFSRWAASDGFCLDRESLGFLPPPCAQNGVAAADLPSKTSLYRQTIDAQSMKDFTPGVESGHDHFFNSFGKFLLVGLRHNGEMLAEAETRAAAENVAYLELMTSPGMDEARALALPLSGETDFDRLTAKLMPALPALVTKTRRHLDAMEAEARHIEHCDTPQPMHACRLTVRYLAQVIRTFPPEQVFAQSLLAYALAAEDPRVVGVNLVAPEDDPVTLRDYDVQMRQLRYLGQRYPTVGLSLHAGELAPGLTPPEDMRFHIADAINIAGARRIGHGVDIAYEDHAADLLREMAQKHVLVEINLTSNDVILGVKGADHPFQTYWKAGVPLALSTDDEGVSRIDFTHEFHRAVASYGLSYLDLKKLVRNSLEYSFLRGASLWQQADYRKPVAACAVRNAPACTAFLSRSDKAGMQATLENAFGSFERSGG